MKQIEYWGEWWIPNEEYGRAAPENSADRPVGVLKFNPEQGGELELIGSFGSIGEPSKQIDTVHGRITEGEFVTLRDCYAQSPGFASGSTSMETQIIDVGQIFSKKLFWDGEPEFEQLVVEFPLLEWWYQVDPVTMEMSREGEIEELNLNREDPITAHLEDTIIKLSLRSRINTQISRKFEICQIAQVTIIPEGRLTFDKYRDEYIRHLQRFICLAVDEPVNPRKISGTITNDQEHQSERDVDVVYRSYHTHEISDIKHSARALFHLRDIEFESAIQNWFRSARGAQTLHNLYFGTRYNDEMFVENQFLSLVVAIEGFQSYLFPDYQLVSDGAYEDISEVILEAIPESSPVHKRIDGLLDSIGNEPSLKNKVSMVFAEYEDILDELIDVEDISRRGTDCRHKLAHGLDDGVDSTEIGHLARKLQVVVEAFLLDEIGLESEYIIDRLKSNRKFHLGG